MLSTSNILFIAFLFKEITSDLTFKTLLSNVRRVPDEGYKNNLQILKALLALSLFNNLLLRITDDSSNDQWSEVSLTHGSL